MLPDMEIFRKIFIHQLETETVLIVPDAAVLMEDVSDVSRLVSVYSGMAYDNLDPELTNLPPPATTTTRTLTAALTTKRRYLLTAAPTSVPCGIASAAHSVAPSRCSPQSITRTATSS